MVWREEERTFGGGNQIGLRSPMGSKWDVLNQIGLRYPLGSRWRRSEHFRVRMGIAGSDPLTFPSLATRKHNFLLVRYFPHFVSMFLIWGGLLIISNGTSVILEVSAHLTCDPFLIP